MNRIKILPESVKNKIAAGEVVEGPFSVVKELMENSIDAGASEIDVEVSDSGLKKILIKDNGKGIYRDDIPLTILKHATSKISDITDIEHISSYGFRGEALSSIASISKLTIMSKSADEETGSRLVSYNEKTEISDYAGAPGSTLIVENLFYNIPARKKFLKSRGTELRKIREIFLKTALVTPHISFSMTVEGKRQTTLMKTGSAEKRVEQIYGRDILDNLYYGSLEDIKVRISGFMSKPDFLKSTRSMQIMYVNNRLIEYKYLGFLLSQAYDAIAPKRSHPAAILFIDIDPELTDVNIHPAKKELKFFDQNYINSMILNLSGKILGAQVHKIKPSLFKTGKERTTEKPDMEFQGSLHEAFQDHPSAAGYSPYTAGDKGFHTAGHPSGSAIPPETAASFIRETAHIYNSIQNINDIRFLGVAFNTYILAEQMEAISIIDFHAAHERFIYDSLIAKDAEFESQSLLFPLVIELSIEDYQILLEKLDNFLYYAFDIDIFSDHSIVVRAIPALLNESGIKDFISDVVESFKAEKNHISDYRKSIAEKMACHAAKRAGDNISDEDARIIAFKALSGDHDFRCPHGRPYIHRIEKKDLEKIFKRP